MGSPAACAAAFFRRLLPDCAATRRPARELCAQQHSTTTAVSVLLTLRILILTEIDCFDCWFGCRRERLAYPLKFTTDAETNGRWRLSAHLR